MPIFNVEIRVIRTYQVENIIAKDEDAASEKAFKKYEKHPEEFLDDILDEVEASEVEA